MSDPTRVYVLQHEYRDDLESELESKFIGVFSSLPEVDRVIARLRSLPGFRESPDDFVTTVFDVGAPAMAPPIE